MRRIILSRKGFDSSTGKTPSRASPILACIGKLFDIIYISLLHSSQLEEPDPEL